MPVNDKVDTVPPQAKTQDEKINESYVKVGELVIKYAKVEQDAQELQAKAQEIQQELRDKVEQLREELKIRAGTHLTKQAE